MRSQIADPTSNLFTPVGSETPHRFLQLAVNPIPSTNGTTHQCGITKHWTLPLDQVDLSKTSRHKLSLPIALPKSGEPFVQIIGSKDRLLFGVYRRHMRTIGYLGQIDEIVGVSATTRSWSTIRSVLRILKTTSQQPTDALAEVGEAISPANSRSKHKTPR